MDNGGPPGTTSPLNLSGTLAGDLLVMGGASVLWPSGSPFLTQNLLIASNSWLVVTNVATAEISGNVMIESGGGINADGAGSGGG